MRHSKLIKFRLYIASSVGLLLLLAAVFILYTLSEKRIEAAHDLRHRSFLLATELRMSSDSMTRMMRTYVVTGKPVFKKHYQDILDIRNGEKPRPEVYGAINWDTLSPGGELPSAESGQKVALLELMRQAGFVPDEFRKLEDAKRHADELMELEFAAMRLVESGGGDLEAKRNEALHMLMDDAYLQAKDGIMKPLGEFSAMLDERTLAAIHSAKRVATVMQYVLVVVGLGLVFMLWRTYAALRGTLGGSVDMVAAEIARIGSGDFSGAVQVKRGLENSVLGWLSAMQVQLNESAITRNEAEKTRSRLAAVVQFSDDAIFSKTTEGIITSWNRGAEKIFGYAAEEAIGRPALLVFPADRGAEEADILQRILRAEVVSHYETVRVRKDGKSIDLSLTVSPLKDASGTIIGASTIARDITDRKQAQAKIQALNANLEHRVAERTAELEAANKELEAFSYSVSHDLRAPLRGIDSFSRMVIEDYGPALDAEGQRQLNVISSEAQRMGQLIDELLSFSRLGRQEIKMATFDMTALAQSVFDDLPEAARQRVKEFRLQPLPPAYGDRAMIRQVLVNLIGNAVKYSEPNEAPVIEVSGETVDGICNYRVKDNGVGFDPRYAHKLFGVFQRLHAEHEFEGTGVGLAIVQRIVHRHGGTVGAEGVLNQGATFSFSLPIKKPNQPSN